MIRGILFDKDGTLFDFAATWEAWARSFLLWLCDGDRDAATRAGAEIGFDMETGHFSHDSIVIAGTPAQVTERLLPLFPGMGRDAMLDILNDEAEKAPQREAVPLAPLLKGFRAAGLKLGVATNDAEAPARAHLGAAGITDLFHFVAGFDSGHGGKPAPGQMLAFAAAMGLDPSEVVMVGDSTHDLHAGRAAGMTCIAVLTGLATEADLAPHADVVLPDIGHLPAWLERQQGQGR